MTKKEQEESPKKEAIKAEAESQKAIGLGELFKQEREKMGLNDLLPAEAHFSPLSFEQLS